MMSLTIRQLEAVTTVAERGSFTRAAAVLGITQPALSQQIRDLEGILGIRLFDRTTRRVEPTRAGADFIVTAQKVLSDLKLAMSSAADLASRARGRLAIAAPPLLASTVLPTAIAAFRKAHPGIEIAVFDIPPDKIVSRVASGEADFGIGTFSAEEPGMLVSPIARDRMMLFELRDNAEVTPLPWAALGGMTHIMLTRESALRFMVDHGLATAGLAVRPAFEVTQIATALAMVSAGLGVAVLPAIARLIGQQPDNIRSRLLVDPDLTRDIGILRAADRSLPPGADDFVRLVTRHISAAVQAS